MSISSRIYDEVFYFKDESYESGEQSFWRNKGKAL